MAACPAYSHVSPACSSLCFAWRVQHVDAFGLAELFDGDGAEFAVAVAAGFHAAEGQVNLGAGGAGVDVDEAGLDVTHGAEGDAHVLGEDGGREAIFRRVRSE